MSGAIKINGTSSGSTTITAPASGGDETIELSTALAAKLDASAYAPGLALVSPASIAYSGGSASSSGGTTTFTGVSSISLNGAFSSTYEVYRIMFSISGSASDPLYYGRLRASGADVTSATYQRQTLYGASSTPAASKATLQTEWLLGQANSSFPGYHLASFDVSKPYKAAPTVITQTAVELDAGDYSAKLSMLNQSDASQRDGITVYVTAGSLSGTIRVYGYEGA